MEAYEITSHQKNYNEVVERTNKFWEILCDTAAKTNFAQVLPLNKVQGLGTLFGYKVTFQERPCVVDGSIKAMKVTFFLEYFEVGDEDMTKPKFAELTSIYILKGGLVQKEIDSKDYLTDIDSYDAANTIAPIIVSAALNSSLLQP
ncbi:hypothetical protein AB8S08_06155 [Pseudidiomarina sp. PP-1MA]|uniref:Bet v I/Major latex protein domain-containing protein n=1 Tax=Pseudidiomarina sp. PP-1MA TaxID=3237706 RepID=A0AB39XCQ3_9GAMM